MRCLVALGILFVATQSYTQSVHYFHIAATHHDHDTALRFFELAKLEGLNINGRNEFAQSAIEVAIEFNNDFAARELYASGADPFLWLLRDAERLDILFRDDKRFAREGVFLLMRHALSHILCSTERIEELMRNPSLAYDMPMQEFRAAIRDFESLYRRYAGVFELQGIQTWRLWLNRDSSAQRLSMARYIFEATERYNGLLENQRFRRWQNDAREITAWEASSNISRNHSYTSSDELFGVHPELSSLPLIRRGLGFESISR